MTMADEMFTLAMKRQRELIDEDLVGLIEDCSMKGQTSCKVDYISDEDKKRLENEGFKILEEEEIKEVYEHTLPVLNKIPSKKSFSYYVIDWSEGDEFFEEENEVQEESSDENLTKELLDKINRLLELLENKEDKNN